jgi:hypothetical protein
MCAAFRPKTAANATCHNANIIILNTHLRNIMEMMISYYLFEAKDKINMWLNRQCSQKHKNRTGNI